MLVDAVNEQSDSRGIVTAPRIRDALLEVFTRKELQARIACACGDGALARGGAAATHPSTGGLNMFWEALMGTHVPDHTLWDPFHLFDSCSRRCLEDDLPAEMRHVCVQYIYIHIIVCS